MTGADIRALRQRASLSAAKFAAELGLAKNGWRTVQRWESGEILITQRTQAQVKAWAKARGIEFESKD